MDSGSSLPARLKEERLRLGFNQTDFAALVGASKNALINWEKGVAAPNANDLATWSEHGLDITYVVTGRRSISKVSTALEQKLLRQAVQDVIASGAQPSGGAVDERYNELYARSVQAGIHPAMPDARAEALLALFNRAPEEGKRLIERMALLEAQGNAGDQPVKPAGDQGAAFGNVRGHGNVIGNIGGVAIGPGARIGGYVVKKSGKPKKKPE